MSDLQYCCYQDNQWAPYPRLADHVRQPSQDEGSGLSLLPGPSTSPSMVRMGGGGHPVGTGKG